MKIQIENLIIEVTRKCNFNCQHCLRGDAQNLDIKSEYLHTLLKNVDTIRQLTFTGGEPQLAVSKIRTILDLVKQYKVDVENFYVATNGVVNSKEFALLMMEWYMYCSENEISSVEVSMDYYHQLEACVEYDSLWISTLKFAQERDKERYLDETFVSQGRWEGKSEYEVSPDDIRIADYWEDSDSTTIAGDFYLNAKGYIINGCDFSYKNQLKHVVGNVRNGWKMFSEKKQSALSIEDWIEEKITELETID